MFSLKKENKFLFSVFIILLLVIVSFYFSFHRKSPEKLGEIPEKAIVTKVVDGDTIVIEGGYHIRLLGIDADEKGYPCYEEAKKELENLILGKKVKLERDKEDKDQYGRYLRYIFLEERNINLEMVQKGLAIARFYPPNVKYRKEIEEAERRAIKNKRGCEWTEREESIPIISPCEADHYLGKEVIVRGRVAETYQSSKGNIFFNFGGKYPNQCFTVVIFSSDVSYFPKDIKAIYTGKIVRVKGIVKEYKRKPEIILKSPLNIQLEDDKEGRLNNNWVYVFEFN